MKRRKASRRRTHARRRSHKMAGNFIGTRKRRTHRRSAPSLHGRRRSHRRSRYLHGAGTFNLTQLAMSGVLGAAGAVGSAFIAGKIPNVPVMLKPAIPLALAVALTMFGKKIPYSKSLALGCAIAGVLGYTKQLAPSLPSIAGVESIPELSAEDVMLGTVDYGAVDFQGDDVVMGVPTI